MKKLLKEILWLIFDVYRITFTALFIFFSIFFIAYRVSNLLTGFTFPEYYGIRMTWFIWGVCAYAHILVLLRYSEGEKEEEIDEDS